MLSALPSQAVLFVQIVAGCPGVGPSSAIALVGAHAVDYQAALAARGYARALAVAGTTRLADGRHDCICLLDDAVERWVGDQALAGLTAHLAPGGALVLDLSREPARGGAYEATLRAAGFRGLQYRVLGPTAGDRSRRPVFLLARRLRPSADQGDARRGDLRSPAVAPLGGGAWGRRVTVAGTLHALDGVLALDPRRFAAPGTVAGPAPSPRRAFRTR